MRAKRDDKIATPDPHDPDQLLTQAEVARLAQVSTRQVYRWRMDETVNFPSNIVLPGGRRRWSRREIVEWLGSRKLAS